jgi:thioredoxin 2
MEVMIDDARHIVCPHCGSVNRIPAEKNAHKAKCGRCHRPLFNGSSTPASTKTLETHLKHNDIPVLVDFWASWCGPCKAMAPVYDRIATEFEPNIRFLKVDTESEPELAARYNIRSIPMGLSLSARAQWMPIPCTPGYASTQRKLRPHPQPKTHQSTHLPHPV